MKKIVYGIIFTLFGLLTVNAKASSSFQIHLEDLGKEQSIAKTINQTIDNQYNITYKSEEDKDIKKIEQATKKVCYLLLGDENTELTVDSYFDRKEAFIDMFYQPDIPKNKEGEYDLTSKEAIDSGVAGFNYSLFKNIASVNPIYKKIGQPMVIKAEDGYYSTIAVKDFEHDSYDDNHPEKLIRETNDLLFYFYFKKLNKEYKLYWSQVYSYQDTDKYFDNLIEQEQNNSYSIKTDFEDISTMFDFSKLNKISDKTFKNLYNKNKKNTVMLNAYYRNNPIHSANGFYLRKGIVMTTWSFVQKALQDAAYISITDSSNTNYLLDGIVYINEDLDLAILKQKEETGIIPKFSSYKNIKSEDPIFTISAKQGYTLKLSSGIYISEENGILKNVLTLTENDQGSPLYNEKGEIIGINTSKLINNNFSNALCIDVVMDLQKQLAKEDFKKIKSISFDTLKEQYFYNYKNDEIIKNTINTKKWNQYKKIGNIEKNINLKLIKASYKNKTMSLRYQNNISSYISSMSMAKQYKDALLKEGYKEKKINSSKYIYENKKYKVIITDQFNYLIVVIMEI